MLGAALGVLGAVLIVGALWFHGGVISLLAGMAAAAFGIIKIAFLMSQSERRLR